MLWMLSVQEIEYEKKLKLLMTYSRRLVLEDLWRGEEIKVCRSILQFQVTAMLGHYLILESRERFTARGAQKKVPACSKRNK